MDNFNAFQTPISGTVFFSYSYSVFKTFLKNFKSQWTDKKDYANSRVNKKNQSKVRNKKFWIRM